MMLEKGRTSPPPPRTFAPEVSPGLDALVVALLAPHPGASSRGSGHPPRARSDRRSRREVRRARRAVRRRESVRRPPAGARAPAEAFVALRRRGPQIVLLQASSGIGKTRLVQQVIGELQRLPDTVVVSGRCHPTETVPYRGFDSLVDRLSRFLLSQPEAEVRALLPRHAAELARVFPVLGRVPALTKAGTPDAGAEPQEVRRRGFAALRELLARIARSAAPRPLDRRRAVERRRQRGAPAGADPPARCSRHVADSVVPE